MIQIIIGRLHSHQSYWSCTRCCCYIDVNPTCTMTSFTLRECIYFTHEQHSKLYVCFLDGKQAFARVRHLGMLYKLHSCVDQTTLSAIRNIYDNMPSCVSNQGVTSYWLPILQWTRQGGKSSPYIYLVYIDGLIKELKEWTWSFFVWTEPHPHVPR